MAPKRSNIWLHFELKEGEKAKCLYCRQVLSVKNGSMGNFNRHMKMKHPATPIKRSGCQLEAGENVSKSLNGSYNANTASKPAADFVDTDVIAGIERKQTDISNFVYPKKPLSVSRTKEIDQQLLRWIVKGYHSFRVV
nr:unnamed protein product [Callosobruchus analis]